ncbi:acyl carrier protein [Paraburkholderia fungorum]|uniref:acyl carrier protein n=1 Tax=Paraburkholderia fungorum TaxID=134537 RepID=UPI0038BC94B4
MLQSPVTTMPTQAGPLSPVAPVTGLSANDSGDGASLFERLMAHAEGMQDKSSQQLSQHLDQLDSGRVSTSDMLRLQADMGAFAVKVQMTVRVADEIGRAIQTLTQRS